MLAIAANTTNASDSSRPHEGLADNLILLSVMPLLAGCGLIYEYVLSRYAEHVVNNVETAIFVMIGVMIMSAGLGAMMSRRIENPFTGLAWIEAIIAFMGATAVLSIAFLLAGAETLSMWFNGNTEFSFTAAFKAALTGEYSVFAMMAPYIVGFVMGFLIGLEMPLVVRIRESLPGVADDHNAATVYALDCVGIAVGTAVWAIVLKNWDASIAAAMTAAVNVVAGLIFYARYRNAIQQKRRLLVLHVLTVVVIAFIATNGIHWQRAVVASL